ncbi:outer membrane protein assembly factor BamB [Catenovulum sp. 2E275]|uniref:outer membrane protein assembly factor BamB n=1 Tax=Catenovulum sp. 2E275 TaxID=2980497 RepID=UPI0021D1A72C|nr:outer membrane protein assembly factor BamB [Catenovulum sp. 2E275]MCU4676995.1 outer membrane protein assembly factor BamB [Catenovulum sp. 2E275]
MKFKQARKTAVAILVISGLVGCASNDEDPDSLPAEKPEIQNQFSTKVEWRKSVGEGIQAFYSRLKPAVGYDKVFAADRSGLITAYEQTSGKQVWEKDIRAKEESYLRWFGINMSADVRVSGMVASYEKLFVGCENGQIYALDINTGEQLWQASVLGEILSAPIAEEGKVIVNLGAGNTVALDADDGKQLWDSISEVPTLTIRGVSSPAYAQGGVFVGGANGKLLTYAAANGQLAWDVAIAKPQGSTELARIVDIDATPIISGYNLYALSAGGALSSIDMRSARVVWKREYRGYENMTLDGSQLLLSDDHSVLYSVDARTGVENWSNLKLRNRQVTAGAVFGDYYVVGDFEGYLYFFNKTDGELVYMRQLDNESLVAQPVVENGLLYVQTREGDLFAISLPQTQDES